jgi:hypothetical protein
VPQHARGGHEGDVEAPSAGLVAEGLREMRFADAGGTLNEDRFVPFDKATGREVEDLLPTRPTNRAGSAPQK